MLFETVGCTLNDTLLTIYTDLSVIACVCAQSCLIFCDPMDCRSPGSSVHGISQAGILEWVAISFSRGSSWPRDWTCISYVCCTGRWILYHWANGEARVIRAPNKIKKECYLLWSCLVDSRRMLLFMVEQVFLLMREVWSMYTADTQYIVGERGGSVKKQRIFIVLP